MNPTVEDAYWHENHANQEYVNEEPYDEFEPAYRAGYEGPGRYQTTYDEAEPQIESNWDEFKGDSKLEWEKAKHGVRAGWHRVERSLPGDADSDGR